MCMYNDCARNDLLTEDAGVLYECKSSNNAFSKRHITVLSSSLGSVPIFL